MRQLFSPDEMRVVEQIKEWKRRRNAIIVAHNYQRPLIQEIADYCGDSLELALKVAQTEADVVVFCGVDFMAETAALLCPDKTVLIPDRHAVCPMAAMATPDAVLEMKERHPDAVVVTYVNSSAAVKAVSDICCTSANAEKIVASIEKPVIFVPDRYLGTWCAQKLKRQDVILWDGFCPTHIAISASDIQKMRSEYPGADIFVHPECRPEVTALADAVLSTGGMVKAASESDAVDFIVATEVGILARLRRENPAKRFFPALGHAVCPSMKAVTLDRLLEALKEMRYEVRVEGGVADNARRAVQRMLDWRRNDDKSDSGKAGS